MGGGEIVAIVISAIIILGALAYIIKAKKRGKKCIGCPDASTCKANDMGCHCHSCDGCNACNKENKTIKK